MPQVKRKETESRMRKMAKAEVDMRKGLYDWPNGLSPTMPNGEGRFQYKELLRVGEYSPSTHNGGKHLFADPYYKKALAKEYARREAKLPSILDANPTELYRLGEGMVSEALIRLENEPESFSTSQLLSFAPQILKVALELKVRDDRPVPQLAHQNPKMQQFNAFIAKTVQIMDSGEREELRESADLGREERMNKLGQMIDAINVSEEEPDGDVIDATVDSKST